MNFAKEMEQSKKRWFCTFIVERSREYAQEMNERRLQAVEQLRQSIAGKEDCYFDEQRYDRDDWEEIIAEQHLIALELKILGEQQLLSSLFTALETHLKNFTKSIGLKIDTSKVENLRANVTDFNDLPGYAEYNELRLLNNAFKHQGVVTSQLAKLGSPYIKGRKFLEIDLDAIFVRLLPGVHTFSAALVRSLSA